MHGTTEASTGVLAYEPHGGAGLRTGERIIVERELLGLNVHSMPVRLGFAACAALMVCTPCFIYMESLRGQPLAWVGFPLLVGFVAFSLTFTLRPRMWVRLTDARFIHRIKNQFGEDDISGMRSVRQLVAADGASHLHHADQYFEEPTGVAERDGPIAAHLLAQADRTFRGNHVRRRSFKPSTTMDQLAQTNEQALLDLRRIGSLPGETLLWAGAPDSPTSMSSIGREMRRRAADALTPSLIPMGVICVWAYTSWQGPKGSLHWLWAIGAGIWLLLSLRSIFVTPVTQARRLARTRYVLTNVRVIAVVGTARGDAYNSMLLSPLVQASLEPVDAVLANVALSYDFSLERLRDARTVYGLLLNAIRGAAGESLPAEA